MRKSQLGLVGRRVCGSLRTRLWTHVLAAGTMAIGFFFFGMFLLIQENLQILIKEWGDEIQINAYLDNGSAARDVLLLRDRIQSFPEVERVRYISRDQAWKDFRVAVGANAHILEGLPEGVLPASFEIFVKPHFRDGPIFEALVRRLRQEKAFTSVEYPQEWVDRISLMLLALQWVKWALGAGLFVAIFFIVRSTVRLVIFAQKDEVEVMQLIGAPEAIIKAPIVIEGMIQGVAGAGFSILGLWFVVLFLRDQIPIPAGFFGSLGQFQFVDWRGIALIFVMGCLLGASASAFSLRRFIKRWDG